jgi:PAS domain S-box-containing protein
VSTQPLPNPPAASNMAEHPGLLRLVANSVPALMAFYERHELRCLFANAAYARTFGHTETSIQGKTLEQIIGEKAAREIEPYVSLVRDQGRPAHYERRLDTPAGPRWLEVELVPHFNADGELLGAFVLITDITRHREAAEALRASEERLAKFMQASV